MNTSIDQYNLSDEQEKWVVTRTKRYKVRRQILRDLIKTQRGCCAWSGVKMRFEKRSLHPPTDHIAAVIDHSSPKSDEDGYSIVCHYLNDTKGKMPLYLFEALRKTEEWKKAMERMKAQQMITPEDSNAIIEGFKRGK